MIDFLLIGNKWKNYFLIFEKNIKQNNLLYKLIDSLVKFYF